MRKTSCALLCGAFFSLLYAESLQDAFIHGKISGQFRSFYVDRAYRGLTDVHRTTIAAGGWLKYETGSWHGASLGVAFYASHRFGIGADNLPGDILDPTLVRRNGDGITYVGEAYLQYKSGNTTFKAGRQRLQTPMAGLDDARMTPNLFEAYTLTNSDLAHTKIIAAHITKFSQGSFGNVYKGGGLAATSGYTYIKPENYPSVFGKDDITAYFINAGKYALGKETNGISAVGVIHDGIENLKLQAWDYYAWDIANIFYLQADLSWKCLLSDSITMKGSVQYIKENDVGDSIGGDVDSSYIGLKLQGSYQNFSAFLAYSKSFEDNIDNPLGSSILTMWGGMPAFTQGMVTRHMFFADTEAYKAATIYKLKEYNLKSVLYITSFDVGKANPYNTGHSWNAHEAGFDFIYYPAKNLQLRFRGNFPRNFYHKADGSSVGWDEYRVILNYNI